jgi:Cys-tRNA(Pro) deacylase
MAQSRYPVTAAIRALRAAGVDYSQHLYDYEERGGTAVASRELGVDQHSCVKTLIMVDGDGQPLVVLMHGDLEVSTRSLARTIGTRSVTPCEPNTASRYSGYLVGGTSPFGTRRPMPVYMESSIATLPRVYINGGKRGFLLEMHPTDVVRLLSPRLVEAGFPAGDRDHP